MTVIEVNSYEPEWRHLFQAASPDGVHVVVSGNGFTADVNGTSDEKDEEYEVHMIVGPFWGGQGVTSVVPVVVASNYRNLNADEDDMQGHYITGLVWDAVSGTGPNVTEERIRLKFTAAVLGEYGQILNFAYYFTAYGRELGKDGLKAPGPVHDQHP